MAAVEHYRSEGYVRVARLLHWLVVVLIAAQFRAAHLVEPTPEQIRAIRLAWADAAA